MPLGQASRSTAARSGTRYDTHASKSSSFSTYSHLSRDDAMPTARQPRIFASAPTTEPTAPAAAETTTVSPGFGWPMSRSPTYAVIPGIPRTPSAVESGAAFGSSFRTPAPRESAYACQPVGPTTKLPVGNAALFEAMTSLTAPPTMGVPSSTGWAYDFASFIRPRM